MADFGEHQAAWRALLGLCQVMIASEVEALKHFDLVDVLIGQTEEVVVRPGGDRKITFKDI